MTAEKVFQAIGEISDDLFLEVEALAFGTIAEAARRARVVKVSVAAAAASVAIAGTLLYLHNRKAKAAA